MPPTNRLAYACMMDAAFFSSMASIGLVSFLVGVASVRLPPGQTNIAMLPLGFVRVLPLCAYLACMLWGDTIEGYYIPPTLWEWI